MPDPNTDDKSAPPPNAAHWSTDYVEHLRTVHFSLVAASVVLIVLSSSRSQTEVQIALTQIQQIGEFSHDFDPNWFVEYVPTVVEGRGLTWGAAHPQVGDADTFQVRSNERGKPIDFEVPFQFGSNNWLLRIKKRERWSAGGGELKQLPSELSGKPEKLRDFRIMWDTSRDGELELDLPAMLGDTAYCFAGPVVSSEAHLTFKRTRIPYEATLSMHVYSDLELDSLKEKHPDEFPVKDKFCYTALIKGKPYYDSILTIPVESFDFLPYDGQSALILHTRPGWDWRHGSFDIAFRQLSQITKDYEELDMASIEKILAGEVKRTGESFEAVGIKFPGENTTRWGTLIILGILVYLWIHLREVSIKLSPTDPG
jgi:hypothetical protein